MVAGPALASVGHGEDLACGRLLFDLKALRHHVTLFKGLVGDPCWWEAWARAP